MKFMSRSALFRLQFLVMLLARGEVVTARFIAGAFEINRKTVYRDMELLRNMGMQIETHMDVGGANGYRLIKLKCPFCQHAVKTDHFEISHLNAGQSPEAFQINLQRAKHRDEVTGI